MVKDITKRIERLRKLTENSGGIMVFFKDGSCKMMDGGDCITLVMGPASNVERFEAHGKGHGLLPDLLNDLL